MNSQELSFEQPKEELLSEQQPGEQRGLLLDPRERSQPEFAAQQKPPGYPPQRYPVLPQRYAPPQAVTGRVQFSGVPPKTNALTEGQPFGVCS